MCIFYREESRHLDKKCNKDYREQKFLNLRKNNKKKSLRKNDYNESNQTKWILDHLIIQLHDLINLYCKIQTPCHSCHSFMHFLYLC